MFQTASKGRLCAGPEPSHVKQKQLKMQRGETKQTAKFVLMETEAEMPCVAELVRPGENCNSSLRLALNDGSWERREMFMYGPKPKLSRAIGYYRNLVFPVAISTVFSLFESNVFVICIEIVPFFL